MASPYKEAVLATSGLVSLWPLDEASGNALDAKGSNPGEAHGTITRAQTSLLPNGEGKSALFDGSTGYFSVPNSASLEIADTVSLETWFKPTALGLAAHSTFADLGAGSASFRMEKTSNKVSTVKSGNLVLTESTTTSSELPYHVVFTKTGATVKLYINGVDVTGSVTNATMEKSSGEKTIGRHAASSIEFMKGYLQFPAVYNAALSEATVKAHYAAGSQSTIPGGVQFPLSRRHPICTG